MPNISLVGRRIETQAATSLIEIACAHEQAVSAGYESLGSIRRRPAPDANSQRLRDVLCDGQQLRHGIERPSSKILIEARNNDALSRIGEFVANSDKFHIEELSFVDSHHLRAFLEQAEDLPRTGHELCSDFHFAMADDVVFVVTRVELRFENLHALPGNLRPAEPANQLLALAAEHAAADHFDPTEISVVLELLAHTVKRTVIIANIMDPYGRNHATRFDPGKRRRSVDRRR